MLRNLFTFLLLITIAIPSSAKAAPDQRQTLETKIHQLQAMVDYLERNFVYHPATLSTGETKQIIHDGANWLVNSQTDNGRFNYEYEPYLGEYINEDNIVRQAGALYQLGEIIRRDTEQRIQLSETIEKSISYFESLSPTDKFAGTEFRCIVEHKKSNKCKLGATSLALIGILSYVEAYPEAKDRYEDLIASYISYILVSKKVEGGFTDQYRVGLDYLGDKESPFSNGEAILALVRAYQYQKDSEVKKVIDDTYTYLKDESYDAALYLWMMAALKDMNKLWPNVEYVDYAVGFTDWRVNQVKFAKTTQNNYCAYVEGVVSAQSLIGSESIRREIDFWNKRNSRLQVLSPYRFQLTDDKLEYLETPNFKQAKGGFLTSHDVLTQRIDFTQHCISSYLQTLVDIDGMKL